MRAALGWGVVELSQTVRGEAGEVGGNVDAFRGRLDIRDFILTFDMTPCEAMQGDSVLSRLPVISVTSAAGGEQAGAAIFAAVVVGIRHNVRPARGILIQWIHTSQTRLDQA